MTENITRFPNQRRFAVMGDNLFKIAERLMKSTRLCRLLKYQDPDPLNEETHVDVSGAELLHKQILIIPKFPETGIESSFVLAVFDNFTIKITYCKRSSIITGIYTNKGFFRHYPLFLLRYYFYKHLFEVD